VPTVIISASAVIVSARASDVTSIAMITAKDKAFENFVFISYFPFKEKN
jgi:hypothetical protein